MSVETITRGRPAACAPAPGTVPCDATVSGSIRARRRHSRIGIPISRKIVYFAAEMRSFLTLATAATLAIALATAPAATVATQTDQKFEQIAALVTQKMAEYGVPGVAFGIVKNGQVTVRGLGVTNLDNPQPVTPDTVFAARLHLQDRDDDGHDAAGRAGQGRSERAGHAVPARIQGAGRGGHAQREDLASADAHARLGGSAHGGGSRRADAGQLHRLACAICRKLRRTRRGVELQQRGLQRRRPRHRSRQRPVDSRRVSHARLRTDRPHARVHAASRTLVTYPFSVAHRGAARTGDGQPAAVALGVGRGRRRVDEPERPAELREVPSRRRHRPRRQARPHARVARTDAHAAGPQELDRRRDGTRLAPAARRRRDDRGARRHARPLPAARARAGAQSRARDPDQPRERLAADSGRRAGGAHSARRHDARSGAGDRPPRRQRDDAGRADPGEAARPGAVSSASTAGRRWA